MKYLWNVFCNLLSHIDIWWKMKLIKKLHPEVNSYWNLREKFTNLDGQNIGDISEDVISSNDTVISSSAANNNEKQQV